MWTPKRIVLLAFGFVMFFVAYGVYAYFLGGVDGLPPLPEMAFPSDDPIINPPPPLAGDNMERKFRMAFGAACEEQNRSIRLEKRDSGFVLAADNFAIEPDGRVKLWPFSIALFAKDKADGLFPEINTVKADVAYLRFDQRIANISDMASRKLVGGELVRNVFIRNNRRSAPSDDDLWLTTEGPVFYEESRKQIWTACDVRIVDEQNRDKNSPTKINASGMDVYLLAEDEKPAADAQVAAAGVPAAPKAADKNAGQKKEKLAVGVSGVKAVALRREVEMRLYIDSNSSFLGSADSAASKASTAKAADKKAGGMDLVQIKTQGPFYYDALTDRARFDVSQNPGGRPNSVEVVRRTGGQGACDQLDCDHLILQFRRKAEKTADGSPFNNAKSTELAIDSAHAWSNPNNQVTLTSDQEVLAAYGNDLVYDARTRTSVLKGAPEMTALKDGNEIRARELLIVHGDKTGEQARIKGPGVIAMLDSATKERTLRARFADQLVFSREADFDVLTLTGQAAFEELEPGQQLKAGQAPKLKQQLQAERLKLWLGPPPASATPTGPQSDAQRRRPHHLEAVGQVSARSAEMTVHDTERLVTWFKDAPAGAAQLPASLPPMAGDQRPAGSDAAAKVETPTAKPADKPRQPIDLSARSVEVHVIRTNTRNDLEKLWCEGAVHVIQPPQNADDKGADIRGQTMQLLRFPEGSVLTVTGDTAEVMLDKLTIFGPEVNIDQKENKAWVNGPGAMRMPSNASFGGGKLDKPAELTVYWTRDMFFNGKYALYHGNVQAEQDSSRLGCETLQVLLDRFVSLKAENHKAGPPARVENLVCDKSVRVEETVREKSQVVRYQRIESVELSFKNEEGVLVAPGPGILRILQLGAKEDGSAPGKPAASGETELKLTRVNYLGRMFANNVTRTAVFYDNVEVVHVPTDDPNLEIDLNKLPEKAMYLRCDQLKVYNPREVGARGMQQMEARGRAQVQAREFYGRADVIKYDENKELMVLEATDGNLASLYRQKAKGLPQEELKGKKIYYWRKTGDFKIEEGRGARVIQ